MGPNALFDKSFLQSLSLDESVWFDRFFYANVCPLFYIETLADLEKQGLNERGREDEVRIIADKFPQVSGMPCTYHVAACVANLKGVSIPMTGQILVSGGHPVKFEGKKAVVFKQSAEAEAFMRWQKREFLEIERLHAKAWRQAVSTIDLEEVAKLLSSMGISGKSCKSLGEAKMLAEATISREYTPRTLMKLLHLFLGIPWDRNEELFARWRRAAFPSLAQFAPYAAYVLTVEIFLQIALAASLISADRASNRVDIVYLFYLPFCMLFVSSDRLHRRCTPVFMRGNQEFVWGPDLKDGLAKLNQHYLQLPESIREQGIISFASSPPKDGDFLVSRLWDRHAPHWRQVRTETPGLDPAGKGEREELFERLKRAPALPPTEVDLDPQHPDMMTMQRLVQTKRGSWWQVPKRLEPTNE